MHSRLRHDLTCILRQICMSMVAFFDSFVCRAQGVLTGYFEFASVTAHVLLRHGHCLSAKSGKCLMDGSTVIKLVAVILSVLLLSVATCSAADISFPDDSNQTCQDDANSFALIGDHALPPPGGAEAYPSYEEQETFHQHLLIFRHTYRGPPLV